MTDERERRNPSNLAANLPVSAQSTWCWLPKKDPTDPNKTVFERINRMVVAGLGSTTAITNVRVILNNLFSPLPIIGHSYSSAQFIGRGSTEVSLTLADVGGNELTEIQAMADEVQGNSRNFRRVKNCNRVKFFGNPLFELTGVKSGIISGISSSTTDNTDLYNMQISFSCDGQHEEVFRQEMYTQSNVYWRLLNTIFEWITYNPRIIQIPQEVASDLRYIDSHSSQRDASFYQRINRVSTYFSNRLNNPEGGDLFWDIAELERQTEIDESGATVNPALDNLWYRPEIFIRSLRRRSTLSTVSDSIASLSGETREAADANKIRIPNDGTNGSYPIRRPTWTVNQGCPLPAAAEQLIPILERHKNKLPIDPFFNGQSAGVILNYQGNRINSGLVSDIPSNAASRSGGTIINYMSRSQLATEINSYRSDLFVLAREVLSEYGSTDRFEEIFPGLFEEFLNSVSATSYPTYPDLDLPPHPVTARTIDMNPDFYFWNDSDESIMNDIGPQLENRLSARTDRLMRSINGLVSHRLFDNTYLDRGLFTPGLDPSNSGSLTGRSSAHEALDERSPLFNYSSNLAADVTRTSFITMRDRIFSSSPSIIGTGGAEGEDSQLRARRIDMIQRATNPPEMSGRVSETDALNVGPVDQQALVNNPEDLNPSVTAPGLINLARQSFFTNPNDVLTMRRAFPTFKLYFIEEDTGPMREHAFARGMNGKIVAYFDDFFNYNSIKDIRLIRSRKQPADLLVCTLINISGILDGRRWTAEGSANRESWEPGLQETELENPLKSVLLKEGMKIQLKLGYDNNPNRLADKFIGELVEVSFNDESPDVVTIVAQSYGVELVCERKISDGSSGFESTQHLLHGIMMSPELAHFGRFDLNPNFNPAEVRTRVSSGTGLIFGLWDSIDTIRDDLARTRSQWVYHNNPADDNIYAPDVLQYKEWYEEILGPLGQAAGWVQRFRERHPIATAAITGVLATNPATLGLALGIKFIPGNWIQGWLSPSVYVPSGETIWEIFKEMELRHPGYIGHPRPYGTRMTMFFGLPAQRYWAHQATQEEMSILRSIEQRLEAQLNPDGSDIGRSGFVRGVELTSSVLNSDLILMSLTLSDALRTRIPINKQMMKFGNEIGFVMGRYRPFRRFHVITSDHHIVLNNIRASGKNTYNAITLTYEGDKTYTMKADDNIQDKDIRMGYFNYPNCCSSDFARRYCIGLLMRYLKDVYKGEIVVTGMNIDPYDIVYLFDRYSDMYGPVEVEQVIDTFSRETGWLTEITPDMCVFANEFSTMITSELYKDWLRENFTPIVYSLAGAGAMSAFNPIIGNAALGGIALGLIGGYYYVKYTQDRQPILIHPLILNNRPFFSGLDGFKLDGVFANIAGKLIAEVDNLQRGWQAFHFSEYVQDWFVSRAMGIAGQGEGSAGVTNVPGE